MNIKNQTRSFLEKIKTELFAADVEKIMAEHYQNQPPGSLEPKHIWQEKVRTSLMELLSGQSATDKAADGFEALTYDLQRTLAPAQMDQIAQEWQSGIENWKNAQKAECLSESLGISEETLIHFYQAANRYFAAQSFEKASNAYYAISTLDPRRHSVWVGLGLSEARLEHWTQAIVSFAMASITDPKAPRPYLYSAECCLKDNRGDEAKIYLNLAEKVLKECPLNLQRELGPALKKLQQMIY